MERRDLDAALRRIYGGRRWIVALDVAAAAHGLVERLATLGVADVMVVSATEGVGDLPAAPIQYTGATGDTLVGGIRAYLRSVQQPSRALLSEIDRFDPRCEASVYAPPFGSLQTVAGRPVYGARPEAWEAMEDKIAVLALWEESGIDVAPWLVTEPAGAPDGPRSALGSVWVADNREGWHGGGDYVRWVRRRADASRAADWFAEHADRVRVMPFLDGIPCSIHGIATGDGIAVLRPLEMIVLRRTDGSGFLYAGACSFWDPDAAARVEMRTVAAKVGAVLRRRHGYVGAYGVDGVLTADGFRPTELNPRLSTGHGLAARSADLPLGMMNRAMIAGDLDVSAKWLEERLLGPADATRGGGMGIPLTGAHERRRAAIAFRGTEAVEVPDEDADAELTLGPGATGGYLMMRVHPQRVSVGASAAPLAVAAIDFARRAWDLAIPAVEPAPDLRPRAARAAP